MSPRRRQVLALVAEGLTNQEIADRLGIRPETVKTHVRAILSELGARNRAHAVTLGFRRGLL